MLMVLLLSLRWPGSMWVERVSGGLDGGTFGVDPILRLNWCIFWMSWRGIKGRTSFQQVLSSWQVRSQGSQCFLVSSAMVGAMVSCWYASMSHAYVVEFAWEEVYGVLEL